MLSSLMIAIAFFVTSSKGQSGGTDEACVARGRGRTAKWGTTCYEFFSYERNWFDASNWCHQYGGSLVSVTGADLQRWLESTVEQLLADRVGVWIGLNDRRGNGTYTWDDISGTGRDARYFNWVTGQASYSGYEQNCVFMLKRFRWQWVNDECYSSHHGYSFVCEFGSSPSLSMLSEATNPDPALPHENVTEVVLTIMKLRSSSGSPNTTIGFNAEREDEERHAKVDENGFNDGNVFIVVGAIVLLAFAAGLTSIVWCHYRRQLKQSRSPSSQGTFTALLVSNPSDDTAIDPRDPTLVTSNGIRAPLCSACRHPCETPSRDFPEYAHCIASDEHPYAQLTEPWLPSDGVGSPSNGVQPVSSDLTEEQAESAHFETAPRVTCRYSAPKCTADSMGTLAENAYVSFEPLVKRCKKDNERPFIPIPCAPSQWPCQSDTTFDCYCVNE